MFWEESQLLLWIMGLKRRKKRLGWPKAQPDNRLMGQGGD